MADAVFVDVSNPKDPIGIVLTVSFNGMLDTLASLLLAVCAFAFAWRLVVATLDFKKNMDATMLLNLPTWWGYAPMGPSFFLLGCAALYTAAKQFNKVGA